MYKVEKIEIIFQFHQGLSALDNEETSRPTLAFNSIKDYLSSPPWTSSDVFVVFQFHQGLSIIDDYK